LALDRRGRRRRRLVTWVKIGFVVLAAAAGVWYAVSTWDETSPALARIGWGAAAASLVPAALATVAAMLSWRRLLADLGSPLPVRPAARVYYTSQLGKYLPGSVWTFVAQVELGRDLKVPRAVSAAVSLLAVALSLSVGLGVAAVLLPFGAGDAMGRYWWLWLIAPVLLAAVHPRVTSWGMNLLLRLLRRPPMVIRPTLRGALAAAGWSLVSWLLLGLHCFILVRATGADAWRILPLAIGGFALAYCAGVLFVPAPAGVGVRELALGAALAASLTPQAAAAVVLVSRLASAAVDLTMAAISVQRRKTEE
jgi:glycosyltransferase 2 family protein